MRKHKHKKNPKIHTLLNTMDHLTKNWMTKIKPLPPKLTLDENLFLDGEDTKLDQIIDTIRTSELKTNIETKAPKSAFPVNIDVVLDDDQIVKSFTESFTNRIPTKKIAWGFGPHTINKSSMLETCGDETSFNDGQCFSSKNFISPTNTHNAPHFKKLI